MEKYHRLEAGDPAPWFRQACAGNPAFKFDTVAGRYVVLCFLGSARGDGGRRALDAIQANRALFDDDRLSLFGVTIDPEDQRQGRIRDMVPGVRFFLDFDASVSRLYGSAPVDVHAGSIQVRQFWMVLDPSLRIRATFPFEADGSDIDRLFACLAGLPPLDRYTGVPVHAPTLYLPDVLEPQLCRQLIGLYQAQGGTESGFMREVGGKTTLITDHGHKRRADLRLEDEAVIQILRTRVLRRIVPEVQRAFQFTATRMERYIIGCYESETGGHFRPHRDNTTKGTAHRRFAVSINLNDDFTGGELSFPEYGGQGMKPPAGGAVVFSCSLLHAVSPVTAGRRYAFLPFLYDEAAAETRARNNAFLDEKVGAYSVN